MTGIWERVKKYVDTERLSGQTIGEVLEELKAQMKATRSSKAQGSMDRLLDEGFVEKTLDFPSIKNELEQYVSIKLPDKVREVDKDRLSIRVKGRKRIYKNTNISIKTIKRGNREAYYITKRGKKGLLTWGYWNKKG